MIDEGNHYRVIPYIKTPAIDIGSGYPPSHFAVFVPADYLGLFGKHTLKTICLDEWSNPDGVEKVWELLQNGGHIITKVFEVRKELRRIGQFRVLEEEPFFIIQRLSGKGGEVPVPPRETGQKTVCLVRYGALGDHVFMSPIVEHFYTLGYHITYNCTERGHAVFKGDKRISRFMVQQHGVVRNTYDELHDYYTKWSKEFDEHYVMDSIIEDNLLRVEGREGFTDSWEKRMVDCERNYVDEHFIRIGRPDIKGRNPVMWFSGKEKEWAKKEIDYVKKKTGKSFIILWSMAGSSFHKIYPWMYDVWSLLQLNGDDVGIITAGDETFGSILEENRFPYVVSRSGKHSIRQTLSLLDEVDLVVTPETNTLIAGLGSKAVVLALLSHSGVENYTWREHDVSLHPSHKNCPCYPCHQLHYSRASCPRGVMEKAATLCMDQIEPGDVYQAILRIKEARSVDDSYAVAE